MRVETVRVFGPAHLLAPVSSQPMTAGSRQLSWPISTAPKHSQVLSTLSTTTNTTLTMLVSLTVGKVDAGVAVLLTEDKRLVSTG